MIRSIAFSKTRLLASTSRCSIEKTVQRRLFAHGTGIVGDGSDDLKNDDRRGLLNAILRNDTLCNSIVYSLAMASREGSKFPPLSRRLNDRENEQLRISRIQRRQFCGSGNGNGNGNGTVTVKAGGEEQQQQHQRRSNSNAEQQHQDRDTSLRTIGEDNDIRNSVAYSLAMEMMAEESEFPPLAHSMNEREKEQLRVSRNQLRHDRMMATNQLYGDDTIGDNTASLMTNDDINDDSLSMAYSLSFSSSPNEGSVKFPSLTRSLNERETEQLRISKNQLLSTSTYPEQRRQQQQHPLPRTLQDALLPSSEAIVITENTKPFRVFDVNCAWEELCGYSYVESKGKSLGSLLGGKETDACAVTALIHQLFVHGEEATTVLTNYTKEGRKFRNRLSVGPLYDEDTGKVSHFVGVLKEVSVAA